jgi:hypothetical protein
MERKLSDIIGQSTFSFARENNFPTTAKWRSTPSCLSASGAIGESFSWPVKRR